LLWAGAPLPALGQIVMDGKPPTINGPIGQAIYASDSPSRWSYSAFYRQRSDDLPSQMMFLSEGALLLVEASLGPLTDIQRIEYDAIPLKGMHSLRGVGRVTPLYGLYSTDETQAAKRVKLSADFRSLAID